MEVVIRKYDPLKNMDSRLIRAIDSLIYENREIPLVYQYLHNPKKELIIDSDNRIGTVSNIKKNDNGDIVGEVTIFNLLKLAQHFVGVIDNVMAIVDPQTNDTSIKAFIVYDKYAKDEINNKTRYIKSGEIPIMSQNNTNVIKEISEKLMSEYESMMNETK